MNKQSRTLSGTLEGIPVRMSLKTFRDLVNEYQCHIASTSSRIESTYDALDRKTSIGFQECTCMINSMREMQEQVRSFYKLLELLDSLPKSIAPLRYPLLIVLHQVDELVSETIWYTAAFRTQCLKDFLQDRTLQRKILRQLEIILQKCEDVTENTNQLFDRARFQEKRFVGLSQF